MMPDKKVKRVHAAITETLAMIGKEIAATVTQWEELAAEIRTLEEQEMANANEHWRDGRYMYLIHSTNHETGDRRREYVGTDPEKQAAARAKVARYRRHQEATRELERLEERIGTVRSRLEMIPMRARGDLWGEW